MERWRLLSATAFMASLATSGLALSFSFVIQEAQASNDHYTKNSYSFHILQGLGAIGSICGSIPTYYSQNVKTTYLVLLYGLTSALASAFFPTADKFGIVAAAICRFICGFGMSAQPFLSNDYVLKWSKKDKENESLAILFAAYPIAATLEGFLFVACEWLNIGWRGAYYIISSYCLLTTLIYATLTLQAKKGEPKQKSDTDLMENKEDSLKNLFANRQIVLFILLFAAMYYGEGMYAVYTNVIMKAATNLSENLVVLVGTPFVLLDILTRLVVGKIADKGKFGLKSIMQFLYSISIIVLTIAIVCGIVYQFFHIPGVPLLLAVAFSLFGIFQSSLWQLFGRAVQLISPNLSNTYFSLCIAISGIFDCALPFSLLGLEGLLAPLALNQMATYACEFSIFLVVTVIAAVVLKMFVKLKMVEGPDEKITIERL